MKRVLALALIGLFLFGCIQQPPETEPDPAADFCFARGGSLEFVDNATYCRLSDGTVCAAQDYYEGACPTVEPSEEPATCGIYSEGDSWPAGDGCNTCTCTKTGIVCTLTTCEPTPSPEPSPSPTPEATGIQAFKEDLETTLNDYFNTTQIGFESGYYGYFERWSAEYQDELWPEPYTFEIRNKNDYRLGYGRERSSNGLSVTWDSRGSTDVHWLEYKCGGYQFWAKTNLIDDLEFYEFVDACTSACQG